MKGATSTGRTQQTALYVAGFLLLWQLVDQLTGVMYGPGGTTPIYPVLALDVLLLLYLGSRWWPLIPLSGLVHSLFFDRHLDVLSSMLVVQLVIAVGFAGGVRYITSVLRVSLPLRSLRDVACFCGILGILVPVAVGTCAISLQVALGRMPVEDVAFQLCHFILGDATSVVLLVPALVTVIEWRQLRSPADHQDPRLLEIVLLVAGTAVFVIGGTFIVSATHEPILDLSFIAMSWLAIRYGIRGAALGAITAYVCATTMHIIVHLPPEMFEQSQGFLFASSLMALLLAGLTNERWHLLARLSRGAYIDELTGLPNRKQLIEWITTHEDSAIVLVIADVDDMRLLNQGVGRVAADHVLQEMAIRLRARFPSSHLIARVSADEFAVAVVDDRSPHAIMSELRAFFDAPFDADGSRVFLTVSMGAVRVIRSRSADELLRKADVALDSAKLTPSRAAVYSAELEVRGAPSLVGELHRAFENGELEPFFQPIFRYDAATQGWRVAGAEALLRWMHPERGVVTPSHFIGLLERLSIGEHVGWDVMERSLLQAREWRRKIPDFRVWVNLFSRQALAHNCVARIAELIERTAVDPDALVVEINEGIVASDERDVAALVGRLREMGVACAIDDFGTGGSSLGRVRDVPANVLKIDRSFVTRSEVDAKAKAVAATVVRLATELGMTVVAEGVENTMQLQVMHETGCEYVQGYALGHPLPADLFARTVLEIGQASTV